MHDAAAATASAAAAGGAGDQVMELLVNQSEKIALSILRGGGDDGNIKTWFDKQLQENEITGFIFYRGIW